MINWYNQQSNNRTPQGEDVLNRAPHSCNSCSVFAAFGSHLLNNLDNFLLELGVGGSDTAHSCVSKLERILGFKKPIGFTSGEQLGREVILFLTFWSIGPLGRVGRG